MIYRLFDHDTLKDMMILSRVHDMVERVIEDERNVFFEDEVLK